MVALNFKAAFADDVEGGRKRRTIRAIGKRTIKPGDKLHFFTGMRTKRCERLGEAICARVREVVIDHMGVAIEGRRLYAGDAPAYLGAVQPEHYDGDFARADGFDCFTDMVDFFAAEHGLPFTGQLIEWND